MPNEEPIHILTAAMFTEMMGNILLQNVFLYFILTEEKPVGEEASLAILVSWTQRKAIFSKDQ